MAAVTNVVMTTSKPEMMKPMNGDQPESCYGHTKRQHIGNADEEEGAPRALPDDRLLLVR